ncbi:MAG TPA: glycine cleavage T C-terminal barrel domain-containing protein [Ignavibacteriaceae bacterium]|nr:glycine cleavage T C-terminal barrel domain-containing protein [Ignavibacteriaceae bacterium]
MYIENSEISPLTAHFKSLGYKFEKSNGYSAFNVFTSVEDEYAILNSGAGLRDISHHSVIELTGNDVLDFLNRITTNNVKSIQPASAIDTIFTNEKGRILDKTKLLHLGNKQLLLGQRSDKIKLINWIEKYIIMDDVVPVHLTGRMVVLEFRGPQSDSFLTLLFGDQVKDFPLNSIKRLFLEQAVITAVKCMDESNSIYFVLIIQPETASFFINYCIANKGVFNFSLIGEEAFDLYRVEKGILSSNELNNNFNPLEANLAWLVNFTKGCYIGQEVIARLDTYKKVQKKLTGVQFIDNNIDFINCTLMGNGEDAGQVTSIVFSPYLKKYIGLAYIRNEYCNEGTSLTAVNNGNKFEVKVKKLPFRN